MCNSRVGWENMISADAVDIITKLLTADHEKRLGANNVNEIKKHPWFKGIDWANLRKREAPILPALEINSQPVSKANLDSEEVHNLLETNESDGISTQELKEIMKHLKEETTSKFETSRFDILDADNQRVAEEMK